jgi:hypothetical protein
VNVKPETTVEEKNHTKEVIKDAAVAAVVTVMVTAGTTFVLGVTANYVNARIAKKRQKNEEN